MTFRQFLTCLAAGRRVPVRRRFTWRPTAESLEVRAVPATVHGDFNGDGYADLAVGSPGEDVVVNGQTRTDAGAVNVIYGSANGLRSWGNQLWTQSNLGAIDTRTGLADSSQGGDKFGAALAVGDFNGDGYADLAVGAPGEDDGPDTGDINTGAVNIIYGSASGLTATKAQYWSQDTPGIRHRSSRNDQWGFSVGAGDFNGDGFDDLVVGCPNNTGGSSNSFHESGVLSVIYGTARGIRPPGDQAFDLSEPGFTGIAAYDHLGWCVAVGDFNGDGYADVAGGLPERDVSGKADAGAVLVLYGSAAGLSASGYQLWTENSTDVVGTAEAGDRFGAALTAGDFNGDGRDDLAIGSPGEDLSGIADAGAVHVLYGSAGRLTAAGNRLLAQGQGGLGDTAKAKDSFGSALAAADFNGDGRADLAIGVPGEDVNGFTDAGAVQVLYGSSAGVRVSGSQFFTQSSPGVNDAPEAGDRFGSALGAGDFNGDGRADLALGVPGEDLNGIADAGVLHTLLGSAAGLVSDTSEFWHQDRSGILDQAEAGDGFGGSLSGKR